MNPSPRKASSVREELLLHSRYIRDTLVPLLARQPKLNHSDTLCLRSIFQILEDTPMTLDLLRTSRIHKALMVIVAAEDASWPMDILVRAEELITKWEDELGPLKNLRADLYGPGGRMEGVRKLTWKGGPGPDDEAKSAWSVEGSPKPSRAHAFGHLGFEVGDWWLKPAAAYRDGIIDETAHAITADTHGAYAIVMTGSCETEMGRDRDIRYKAAVDDPSVFRLTKTMLREDPDEKVVRVLRSWRLRSNIAPKAGLRYDGLYRVTSFSIHLSPPTTYHTLFTLSRVPNQPSLLPALHIPTSDQLDDWKDYQRLKLVDRGDDFAMLREILAQRPAARGEDGYDGDVDDGEGKMERQGSEDSGYFSRRGSKAMSAMSGSFGEGVGGRREEGGVEGMEGIVEGGEDDEGAADLEDLDEEDDDEVDVGRHAPLKHFSTHRQTSSFGSAPAAAVHHSHPPHQEHGRVRFGSSFLAPAAKGKAVDTVLSTEEAVVGRRRGGQRV